MNFKKLTVLNLLTLLLLTVSSLCFISCDSDDPKNEGKTIPNNTITAYKTPKYVFFFIGDGMSTPQINITEAALQSKQMKSVNGELNLRKFPVTGLQTTHAQNRYITGSAASATALATGVKTSIGTVSKNANRTEDLKTMAELAKEQGKKVGIISSVSIDHATPACFYAHVDSRGQYQDIGQFLLKSNFDYFAGGNVRFNKYKDYTLGNFISDAEAKGYKYITSKAKFDALNKDSGKVIATLEYLKKFTGDGSAMPYMVDLDEFESANDRISLSDFTKKGIEVLDNENGFFMMVEGGKIDWACHANDVVSAIQDVVDFDKAVGYALDFYNEHPEETLIIVTGDHECGGLSLGHSATGYDTAFELLQYQKQSYWFFEEKVINWREKGSVSFETAMQEVQKVFGLGDKTKKLGLNDYEISLLKKAFNKSMGGESTAAPEEISVIYGYYDPFTVTITHILNNKAGVDWTTYSHTATPVPVFAIGQGQYEFGGYYDNTDIGKRIIKVAGYKK